MRLMKSQFLSTSAQIQSRIVTTCRFSRMKIYSHQWIRLSLKPTKLKYEQASSRSWFVTPSVYRAEQTRAAEEHNEQSSTSNEQRAGTAAAPVSRPIVWAMQIENGSKLE